MYYIILQGCRVSVSSGFGSFRFRFMSGRVIPVSTPFRFIPVRFLQFGLHSVPFRFVICLRICVLGYAPVHHSYAFVHSVSFRLPIDNLAVRSMFVHVKLPSCRLNAIVSRRFYLTLRFKHPVPSGHCVSIPVHSGSWAEFVVPVHSGS